MDWDGRNLNNYSKLSIRWDKYLGAEFLLASVLLRQRQSNFLVRFERGIG